MRQSKLVKTSKLMILEKANFYTALSVIIAEWPNPTVHNKSREEKNKNKVGNARWASPVLYDKIDYRFLSNEKVRKIKQP